MNLSPDAGVTLETARYLVEEKNVYLLGDDQSAFENFPPGQVSSYPGHIHPVHHYLLIQQGVHIMEMLQLAELARDKVYEFCFIGLPNKIRCSTGMMIRPVAVV
jgi:kynurenine formamidase